MTIAQPQGAWNFHLTPHAEGCSMPPPFNGPTANVVFNDLGMSAKVGA